MKLWIDDVRPAPDGYAWAKSVEGAIASIEAYENAAALSYINGQIDNAFKNWIELIDIDHDAGDYAWAGGDYIKLLDWLEETGRNYPIRIHSMNPVGVANMRAIIERNSWKEIK